jgi:hypothetical protein
LAGAQAHDAAFAELFLDRLDREFEGFGFGAVLVLLTNF